MNLYNEKWQAVLIRNGWNDFDRIWSLELDWFEEPNHKKNGWSGVSKSTLSLANGKKYNVFIKRQENTLTRSVFHPITGVPTLRRELANIEHIQKLNIPTVESIYYGERRLKNHYRAILITLALEQYQSLEAIFVEKYTALSRTRKNLILLQIAILIRRLHQNHYVHNCLYPKHIFLNLEKLYQGKTDSVRLIDLEKAKFHFRVKKCMLRDFDTLHRHSITLSRTDLMRFLLFYRSETHLTEGFKKDWTYLRD